MKKLIIVNGATGSGKSAVCQRLYPMLERSVYLDGDWCWTCLLYTSRRIFSANVPM